MVFGLDCIEVFGLDCIEVFGLDCIEIVVKQGTHLAHDYTNIPNCIVL